MIIFRISTIREWIEQELQIPNLPFEYDLENIIDDWVLLCFFVGNDFLPHLPSLDIKEGAIDKLVGIYKSKLKPGFYVPSLFLFKSHFLLSFFRGCQRDGWLHDTGWSCEFKSGRVCDESYWPDGRFNFQKATRG